MEGVGQLTEEILLVRYDQTDPHSVVHPSPLSRTPGWGWGKKSETYREELIREEERKPSQRSATEARKGKRFRKEPEEGEGLPHQMA